MIFSGARVRVGALALCCVLHFVLLVDVFLRNGDALPVGRGALRFVFLCVCSLHYSACGCFA